ncbi:hypothetical protein AYO21_09518 [Fonsecaea monophora]|uniref:Uncharacterized protein n=1 Tax=Fonsecaea monophora TaxID=254056 RepID=A0A177EXD8_9EURO|nr:hypothetical protein AYO21_09518 [Fonsecaea monophora]OAG36276.1 hypothetical protein AYO21_09518 [Fonsecaea monophora]
MSVVDAWEAISSEMSVTSVATCDNTLSSPPGHIDDSKKKKIDQGPLPKVYPIKLGSRKLSAMDMLASHARRGSRSVRPKTQLRDGDILILRAGFTTGMGAFVGLEATEESAQWIRNHHFAVVATDTLGFDRGHPEYAP